VDGQGPPFGKYGNSDGPLNVGLPGLIKIWNVVGVAVVVGGGDGVEVVVVVVVSTTAVEGCCLLKLADVVDARLVTIHVVSQISIDRLLRGLL